QTATVFDGQRLPCRRLNRRNVQVELGDEVVDPPVDALRQVAARGSPGLVLLVRRRLLDHERERRPPKRSPAVATAKQDRPAHPLEKPGHRRLNVDVTRVYLVGVDVEGARSQDRLAFPETTQRVELAAAGRDQVAGEREQPEPNLGA